MADKDDAREIRLLNPSPEFSHPSGGSGAPALKNLHPEKRDELMFDAQIDVNLQDR